MDIFILILISLGVGGVALKLLRWLAENFVDLPDLTPEAPLRPPKNPSARKILLNPQNQPHQREQPLRVNSPYNKPMDIVPDDEILTPPRQVTGRNGEQ